MYQKVSQLIHSRIIPYYQIAIESDLECLGYQGEIFLRHLEELEKELNAEILLSEAQQDRLLEEIIDFCSELFANIQKGL